MAILKGIFCYYLTINYITRKWTMPVRDWNVAMTYFMIKFEGRI